MTQSRITLDKLFERNNIETESYMSSIYIEGVKLFTKDNRLEITMTSDDLISESIILNIKEFFERNLMMLI